MLIQAHKWIGEPFKVRAWEARVGKRRGTFFKNLLTVSFFFDKVKWAKYMVNSDICRELVASRTNPGRGMVLIVQKVPYRACEAPVGRARVK